jgi:3-oxoacyl-[acyl-carrier-protein] synthase II
MRPSGDSISRAIRSALELAGLSTYKIGHVNAHGVSTREDDAAEAQAIRATLGDVPVTAPKSFFGNLGPGSGMVELAVSLVGMSHGAVPLTINYETPDPECPVNVVTEVEDAKTGAFVKLSHNSTGQAVAVVVTED